MATGPAERITAGGPVVTVHPTRSPIRRWPGRPWPAALSRPATSVSVRGPGRLPDRCRPDPRAAAPRSSVGRRRVVGPVRLVGRAGTSWPHPLSPSQPIHGFQSRRHVERRPAARRPADGAGTGGVLAAEAARRRTFAIISHPDAGKTTLTEKLLLYGGAIHLAGSVKARRAQRHATSDWMELEQERGISVTSSVHAVRLRRLPRSTCSTRPATRTSPRTRTAR